jgi:hypothetical protein
MPHSAPVVSGCRQRVACLLLCAGRRVCVCGRCQRAAVRVPPRRRRARAPALSGQRRCCCGGREHVDDEEPDERRVDGWSRSDVAQILRVVSASAGRVAASPHHSHPRPLICSSPTPPPPPMASSSYAMPPPVAVPARGPSPNGNLAAPQSSPRGSSPNPSASPRSAAAANNASSWLASAPSRRLRIFHALSFPACRLFSARGQALSVSDFDLDAVVLAAGGGSEGLEAALAMVKELDSEGLKLEAVDQLNLTIAQRHQTRTTIAMLEAAAASAQGTVSSSPTSASAANAALAPLLSVLPSQPPTASDVAGLVERMLVEGMCGVDPALPLSDVLKALVKTPNSTHLSPPTPTNLIGCIAALAHTMRRRVLSRHLLSSASGALLLNPLPANFTAGQLAAILRASRDNLFWTFRHLHHAQTEQSRDEAAAASSPTSAAATLKYPKDLAGLIKRLGTMHEQCTGLPPLPPLPQASLTNDSPRVSAFGMMPPAINFPAPTPIVPLATAATVEAAAAQQQQLQAPSAFAQAFLPASPNTGTHSTSVPIVSQSPTAAQHQAAKLNSFMPTENGPLLVQPALTAAPQQPLPMMSPTSSSPHRHDSLGPPPDASMGGSSSAAAGSRMRHVSISPTPRGSDPSQYASHASDALSSSARTMAQQTRQEQLPPRTPSSQNGNASAGRVSSSPLPQQQSPNGSGVNPTSEARLRLDRAVLLTALSYPRCKLFSASPTPIQLTDHHLDKLLKEAGHVDAACTLVRNMEKEGVRVSTVDGLMTAFIAQAASERREELVQHLLYPRCTLFTQCTRPIEIEDEDLDRLLEIAGALPLAIRAVQHFEKQQRKFFSFAEMCLAMEAEDGVRRRKMKLQQAEANGYAATAVEYSPSPSQLPANYAGLPNPPPIQPNDRQEVLFPLLARALQGVESPAAAPLHVGLRPDSSLLNRGDLSRNSSVGAYNSQQVSPSQYSRNTVSGPGDQGFTPPPSGMRR